MKQCRRVAVQQYYENNSYNNMFNVENLLKSNIFFPDPPEVKEEQSIVFTVEGQETEIVCIVHAEPKADVSNFFFENFQPCI